MGGRATVRALHARTPTLESPPADWGFRYRDLIAACVLVPATLLTLFSRPAVLEGSSLDLAFDLAGWLLFFSAAALRFWATLYIGGRKHDVIVTDGPYSICRHPLYLASFLMTLSAALFLKSVVLAAGAFVAGSAYLLITVRQEEAALARLHPRGWAHYASRVPAVLPRLAGWRTPARIEVDMRSLRDEAARATRWMLLPLLAELASHLRAQPWWPHLLHRAW